MYYVSLIDKNNSEFDIFCSKSQCDLDKFTTLFVNSTAVLNQLGIKSKDFNISVKKRQAGISETMNFVGSNYRSVIQFYKNHDLQVDFVNYLKKIDSELLLKFFRNELFDLTNKNDFNDYDKKFSESLKSIIDSLEIEMPDENSPYGRTINEELTKEQMKYINSYFFDFYGKPLYKSFKNMFIFLVDVGVIETKPIYSKEEVDNAKMQLEDIKKKINNVLDSKKELFIDSKYVKKCKKENYEYDESELNPTDYINRYNDEDVDDIDETMNELDMALDSMGYDEDLKREYLNKHKKNIFKNRD
ncbi:MAG: hypothetical protein IIZ40_00885 [Bacilli bacterium]|nr:hypothetical protein [Bacilli bacterium]